MASILELYLDEFEVTETGFSSGGNGSVTISTSLSFSIAFGGNGAASVTPAIVVTPLNEWDFSEDGVVITKRINDAMWSLSGSIVGITTPTLFDHIRITMTDHLNNTHTVFYGFLSETRYLLEPASKTAQVRGWDYGWFLSHQFGKFRHLKEWTSAEGPDYNHDEVSEDTPPVELVKRLIGYDPFASYYAIESGIYPYMLTTVANYGTTIPKKMFTVNEDTTLWQTLQEISDHCNYIFHIKPMDFGASGYLPVLYWVPWENIDDPDFGLDLPAAATIDDGDGYALRIEVDDNDSEKINEVTVWGMEVDGGTDVWVTASAKTDARTNYEELAMQYHVKRPELTTEAECQTAADEYLAALEDPPTTYKVNLWKRVDLELYQKIKFTGFDVVPESWMRIIGITYRHSRQGTFCEVECVLDADLSKLVKMRQLLWNRVTETKAIARDTVREMVPDNLTGTVTGVTGDEGTIELDKDGRTIKVRILNP